MKRLLVGFAMLLAGIGGAWGDEAYPNRPIEWVVPFGAGGGSDRWARIMSSAAIDAFGQPWNVRNVGGDQGRKGWRYILEQPADGYTVLQGSMTPSISALRDRKSGFTPYDIRIAAFISTIKTHLIAAPAAAFTDWKGLVVRTGNGAVPRIGGTSAVLLSAAAGLGQFGIEADYRSFSGTGDAVDALLAGQIDLAAVSTSTALSLIGKAPAIINLGGRDNAPEIKAKIGDIPWIGALGGIGSGVPRWVGVHPDTPDPIVDRISESVGQVLGDKSVIKLMEQLGEDIRYLPGMQADGAYRRLLDNAERLAQLMR